jgi:hypothetical protein
MAVALEFLNLIIPIQNIERVYPGGFEQFKIDNVDQIGKSIWYDDYILRDGDMGWQDIEVKLYYWEKLGLKLSNRIESKNVSWAEVCVMYDVDGPSMPCDWIESEFFSFTANLKGVPKCKRVSREDMVNSEELN